MKIETCDANVLSQPRWKKTVKHYNKVYPVTIKKLDKFVQRWDELVDRDVKFEYLNATAEQAERLRVKVKKR